jgi:hypothetical protein
MTPGISQPNMSEPMTTALFFAEARNRAEVDELADLARDLARHGEIRAVSQGAISAYAVVLPASGAPLLSGLETTLKRDFVFGHVELPFQETILRVVEDLAMATDSRLFPVEECEICHVPEPFPADVQVMGEDGQPRRSHSVYCATCAAEMAAGRIEQPAAETRPRATAAR